MVFVSDSFVFVFLPLFLISYVIVAASLRNLTILLFSLIFYGWWRFDFLPLLIAIACWFWLTGLWIARAAGAQRRMAMLAGIVSPLLSLIYFKYVNLLVDSATSLGAPIKDWSPFPCRSDCPSSYSARCRIRWTFRRTVAAEPSNDGLCSKVNCSIIRIPKR